MPAMSRRSYERIEVSGKARMKKFVAAVACLAALVLSAAEPRDARPNIVWIFGEDMGPELGCYGDAQAITPNMDRLAREGVRFNNCFTHAPVCAPSRSGLITGMYPTSIGTHHMRSQLLKPPPMFTEYLRQTGYLVCWPTKTGLGKTDFNFTVPPKAFDVTTDWTTNIPRQPFFAFANIFVSHESQIRAPKKQFEKDIAQLKPAERHRPAAMKLPAYYPDAPEVRRDLANYYDLVTAVDYRVGEILASLEKAGVADNTVIILTGDHGRGLPRSKRWVYHQGIHVPLIVRWPGKIQPGTVRDDLVSFIDFAPTTMALAAVKPFSPGAAGAEKIPGTGSATKIYSPLEGIVFLGPQTQTREYVFAARDRMDETFDRIRTVRDKQFQYIRNFHPELPYAQRITYLEEMPTMQVWRQWNAAGKLQGPQKLFFAPTKPPEELYDALADADEVNNLADSPAHQKKLAELRAALDTWIEQTHDMGAIPETELIKRGLVADKLAEYEQRK